MSKLTKISKYPDRILSFLIAAEELNIFRDFSIITDKAIFPRNGINADVHAIAMQSIRVKVTRLKNPGNIPR